MLFKAQLAARNAARGKRGFGYIMEQGLGKTLTYEDEFLELAEEGAVTRSVVVAPNSFKQGWVKEIEKWNLGISPHVLDAKGAEYWTNRFINSAHHKPPQIIVNYEAIRSPRIRELLSQFIDGRAASIAFDESIQISAHDAAQTKAAIELAKQFQHRRILSGKWMRTGPHNFWPQLRAIGALDGFNFYAWRNRFCKMGGFKGKQVVGIRPGTEERLAEIIRPYIFEAKKKDWTDLPPKTYSIREYSLGPLQSHYDSMMEEFMVFLNSEENVSVDAAITKYIKLAQIQCGFIIDEDGQARQLISDQHNPRLNTLLEFMTDELEGKIAIPYQHKYSYDLLSRALVRWQPAYITGGMTGDAIELQKARFNGDNSCRAILLQTKSSKYGHTLLGEQSTPIHACSTMAFWENTYDTDDREQIEDRPHRYGQEQESVNYIDFVGTPIDMKMIIALQERKELYEAIMGFVSSISADSQQSD